MVIGTLGPQGYADTNIDRMSLIIAVHGMHGRSLSGTRVHLSALVWKDLYV